MLLVVPGATWAVRRNCSQFTFNPVSSGSFTERLLHLLDYLFVIITGAIAYHGITYRDENGDSDLGHLLFGCIALLFCIRVVMVDILKLW